MLTIVLGQKIPEEIRGVKFLRAQGLPFGGWKEIEPEGTLFCLPEFPIFNLRVSCFFLNMREIWDVHFEGASHSLLAGTPLGDDWKGLDLFPIKRKRDFKGGPYGMMNVCEFNREV